MFGYRSGRLMAFASGGAVSAIALMVLVSPLALGVSHTAPYTGVVAKSDYSDTSGCATDHGTLGFALSTGIAAGTSAATAKTCTKHLGAVGTSSDGYNEPGVQAAINLRLPTGYHHVAENWAVNAAAKGAEVSTSPCPTAPHYRNSYAFHYGSYYYWDNSTGQNQYCSSDASVYSYMYSYIEDLTTGQTYNYTYNQVFDTYMDTYNSTYWDCYNDTVWNGTAYSYYSGCYGYNRTTTTYAYINGVYYSSWTGPTNFNNTTSQAVTMYANNTWAGTHHYILYVEFYIDASAYVQTWHAAASASVNMATGGNGAHLVKIVVT